MDYTVGGYFVISIADPEHACAEDLGSRIRSTAANGDRFFLALSGGSSPRRLYSLLAEEDIPWASVFILQVDERIVPPGHDDHNMSMIRSTLIDRVPIPEDQVIAVDTEGRPDSYGSTVDRLLSMYRKEGLDAAVLGLGEDGHTASVFPEEEAPFSHTETAYLSSSPRHPHERLTLSLPFLARSGMLFLLVKGRKKRAALSRLLGRTRSGKNPFRHEGGGRIQTFPAANLPKNALIIYTDLESSDFLGENGS
mgnify:CR=1 FL=1